MVIRSSNDIQVFLDEFKRFAAYDSTNGKYYFVFHDKDRGGQLTLMLLNDEWSFHGLGEGYCDKEESSLPLEESQRFVWYHRKAINKSIKESLITS